MARKRERAFAGFFAVLFLLSASATTIAVIATLVQQHDQNATPATNTSTNNSSSTNSQDKSVDNQKKLQGTALANFTPTTDITQLQEVDTTLGTGAVVKAGDTITVDYTGAVAATGTIFQSSLDSGQPATLSLKSVIPGWSQGIPGMKVGGTRRLLIPASLAYGANPPPSSGIPANAPLVFDVTVHKID